MAAHLVLNDRIQVYEDVLSSNSPEKVLLDYTFLLDTSLTSYNRYDLLKTGIFTEVITLPAVSCSFLYALTDQTVSFRFNGEVDNNTIVSPSVAGTKDGIFYKRGAFTSLSIAQLAAVTTKITLFLGV